MERESTLRIQHSQLSLFPEDLQVQYRSVTAKHNPSRLLLLCFGGYKMGGSGTDHQNRIQALKPL